MEATSHPHFLFRLNRAIFALDALAVREVLPLPALAAVEETPPYVAGAINLRGRVVPVLDLNLRFGHPTLPGKPEDALVIVAVDNLLAGVQVSEALEVVDIPPHLVEPPPLPESPARIFPPFVLGNARVGEELVMVLDHGLLIRWVDPGGWKPELLPGLPEDSELAAFAAAEGGPAGNAAEILRRRAVALQAPVQVEEEAAGNQVAAFLLGGEFFAVALGQIQEFAPLRTLTPLPNCPAHVVGCVNLHGSILTALDLRGVLGLPVRSFSPSSQLVIAAAAGRRAAIVVDEIDDIVGFQPADLVPLPAPGESGAKASISGTLPYRGKSLMLLDLESLFADHDLAIKPAG